MSRVAASVVLVLSVAVVPSAGASPGDPATPLPESLPEPEGWPGKSPFPEEPPGLGAAVQALPRPSLREPFAIGEALYDPARVGDAVVSLLELMGVRVDGPDGNPILSGHQSAAAPFRLTDAEVRGLIAMGIADARGGMRRGRPPYAFRHLHAALAPLIGGVSIEQLAETYSRAYTMHPDALVPRVLMGQPIAPETPLMRTQLWLLLVDGFAPPAGTPRKNQVVPARLAATGATPAWGTAGALLPQIPSPDPRWSLEDWTHLIGLLPVVAWRVPFEVAPMPAMAHEGHGGPGATVTLEARLGGPAPVITSPTSGHVLLAPSRHDLGGRSVTWRVHDAAALAEHGSFSPQNDAPVPTDPAGVSRISFEPREEQANGRGRDVSEGSAIDARIGAWDLLSAHYDLPPALSGFVLGDVLAPGSLLIEWHSEEWLDIDIENVYNIVLGPLGKQQRVGKDRAVGTLHPQADGRYRGIVKAHTNSAITVEGLGQACSGNYVGWQDLLVVGRAISGFGGAQQDPGQFEWITGQPDGGYLALEFFPVSAARESRSDPCQEKIDAPAGRPPFMPLNDARWTVAHTGYPIALPASGTLVYTERTLAHDWLPVVAGASKWFVRIERETAQP